MILARCILTLLGIIALQSTGRADFLEANDQQTCRDLCRNCDGTATFVDNVCQCHVTDDHQRGAECIGRINRQAGELGLDIVSCDLADPDADRAARCIVSPFRRFKSQSDADLIAKYFMDGLGGLGGLLGSSTSKSGEPNVGSEKSESSSVAENADAKMQGSDNKLNSDSALVGAPNPLASGSPMSGQMMGANPLLGAAAAWLNPQTLFALGNGMQGRGTHSFVGQPNPSSMSGSANYNHEIDSNNGAGSMLGIAPQSYYVGAPNPAQLQDGSQGLPMQPSYLYTYNSMVGAENPSFVGLSPYCNYPTPLTGMNNPQSADPAADPESKSDPNLGANKDTDLEEKKDELETMVKEIEEPVVGSEQTDTNLKENAANLEEVKEQTLDSSSHSKKRRQSRFRSKARDAKSESTIKNVNPEASDGAD